MTAVRAKLDENLGRRGHALLLGAGWDVETVVSQDLCRATDAVLSEVCRAEGRALITLDTDFANTVAYPPARFAGIVVLRPAHPIRLAAIEAALSRVVDAVSTGQALSGRLWVVDEARLRVFAAGQEP